MVKNLGFFIKKVDNSLRSSSSYLEEMRDVKVHVQYLGDMLLVYAPEKRDIVRSMYSLTVLRTCELIRKIASRGTFVRGALMRGLGWELSTEGGHRTLYGPVMSDAYRLMTDIAWKPRIVIDEEIFEVVSSRASYGPGPDGDWLPKYSKRDYDGVGIVNYLVYDNEYVMAKPDEARTVVSDLKKSCESILRYVKFLAGRTERHDYASHAQRLVPLYEEMSSALMDWERGTSTVAMTR